MIASQGPGQGEDLPGKGRRPRASRRRIVLLLTVLVAGILTWMWVRGGRGAPNPDLSFSGDTRDLLRTQVVPTLDTPIEPGKNAVWCATFLAGWKQLDQKVAKGPVKVTGAEDVCARLNAAADPSTYLPPETYYANAGTEDKGILQTIEKDMAARFPKHRVPTFDGIVPGSFVLYAYLEARVPFPVPYFDNREPLTFTDSGGKTAAIRSFGLRKEDRDRYGALRSQARLLMAEWPESGAEMDQPPTSFAVDLCADSNPCQIIVACVDRGETLAATLDELNTAIEANAGEHGGDQFLGGNDILLVPDMFWRFIHHFSELEHRLIDSPPIQGQEISLALQEIQFRLDRSGAELSSEAVQLWASAAGLGHYIFDRPFLLFVKQRGAQLPFFVMWVDNVELLQPWEA